MKPVTAPPELRGMVERMLNDLAVQGLSVTLLPSCDDDAAIRGAKIRAAIERNPDWYRELCAAHPRLRRLRPVKRRKKHLRAEKYTDSVIDRRRVAQCLESLLGGGSRSKYAASLLDIARDLGAETDEVPF